MWPDCGFSWVYNIKNYEGPERQIVIHADNDGPHARTNDVIQKAQEYLSTQDKSVVVIRPSKSGQDFNDVLKESGIKVIQAYLEESSLKLPDVSKGRLSQSSQEESSVLDISLEEKLLAWEKDPGNRSLRQELLQQAKILRHDPALLEELKSTNPDIAQKMERMIQEQNRRHSMAR